MHPLGLELTASPSIPLFYEEEVPVKPLLIGTFRSLLLLAVLNFGILNFGISCRKNIFTCINTDHIVVDNVCAWVYDCYATFYVTGLSSFSSPQS